MCPASERLVELVDGRLDADAQREIEEHIDTCEACRVGLAAAVRAGEAPATWSLGRYRIDDVIGSGGMGIVYRAWDPSLSREVAIKVVKSDDAELRGRLAREAQSLARLNHRNVCQVYDVGTDDDELWIAMELVRGTTLRAWIAAKPATARDEVLEVLAGAGRGLAAAHAAGLVHRDVKPENILVDRDGRAVVSDFGLARDLGDRATRTSVLAGTPAYMAPEQLDGSPADARSDQYAFAVTAHEALVGARPRPRNHASATLPPRLRAAIERALADDPAARWDSLDQLVAAFVAPPPRRHARTFAIGAVLAAVVALGATGVWMLSRGSSTTARAPAVANTEPPVAPDAAVVDATLAVAPPADAAPPVPPPAKPDRPAKAVAPAELPKQPPAAAPAVAGARGDVNSLVAAIGRAIVAGDGKACTAALTGLDGLQLPEALVKPMMQMRGQCLMLAGQCDAGKRAVRAHWQSYNFTDAQVEKSVDLDVAIHCRSGARSERDRLLRAMFVLGDFNYKHTLAECREAYAEAKQLVGKVPGGDGDMLQDAQDRFVSYAPGCFARVGDCPTAWRVMKELHATARRDATDFTARAAFVDAVNLACADKDQGPLTDAEVVWRSIVELDKVKSAGTRPAAYCTTRIDRAVAALARLGDVSADPELRRAPGQLASEGAACLAVTADCATAWQRFVALDGGGDEARLRKRFRSAVRACEREVAAD